MQEPPIDFDNMYEPEDVDRDYGSELIESHVEAVEMRDAENHSARVERHRPTRRPNKSGNGRKRSGRRQPRDSYSDDGQDSDDSSSSKPGRGIFRYGAVITLGIAAISAIAILLLFAISHNSHVPDPSLEIKPRSTANDNYPTIQPKPQTTRPPVVNTSNSRLKSNQR